MKLHVYKIFSGDRWYADSNFATDLEERSPMFTNRSKAEKKIREMQNDYKNLLNLNPSKQWYQDRHDFWSKADVATFELVRKD